MEKNIKLTLAYNGNYFYGWQKQKDSVSVQQTIEDAVKKISGEKVNVIGCGRTDSKTHALSYIANFRIQTRLDVKEIKNALNANLPFSILIKKVEATDANFHSRYNAKSKIYRYLITLTPSPFLKNLTYLIKQPIDIQKMEKGAVYFIGKHDFASFQSAGSPVKNTVREIKKISFKWEKFTFNSEIKILAVEIEANGFLYKMARNITGTLIEVGKGKIKPEKVKEILEALDRKKAPAPVPAYGLYLKKVKY